MFFSFSAWAEMTPRGDRYACAPRAHTAGLPLKHVGSVVNRRLLDDRKGNAAAPHLRAGRWYNQDRSIVRDPQSGKTYRETIA